MGFRFSLQTLLRVRRSFERREILQLEILSREMLRRQSDLDAVDQRLGILTTSIGAMLAGGMIGGELEFSADGKASVELSRAEIQRQLANVRGQIEVQQGRLRAAQQKRQVLEKLRETQFGGYRLAEARLDQQRQDDLFLMRQNRAAAEETKTDDGRDGCEKEE